LYLLFQIKFAHRPVSALALIRILRANFFLNQEDTVKEASSPAVRKARPTVRKLDARHVFRSEYYLTLYRRSGRAVNGSQVTTHIP
jgi:hypothetical protein